MNKNAMWILILVPLACCAMTVTETVLVPAYGIKVGIRILLFAGSFLAYALYFREPEMKQLFSPASVIPALVLAVGAFVVLLGGYSLLREWIDLDAIAGELTASQNISRDNFLLVSLYICLVNSFLEELFFRGFGYLTLRRHWGEIPAQVFSAAAFSLYHVSILSGWFPWWLFALLIWGLFVCGLLFNLLDYKGSLLPAWLLHGASNIAINLIGYSMFDMMG